MTNIEKLEFEYNVIGSIIADSVNYLVVSDILTPECFQSSVCGVIYREIQKMRNVSKEVNLMTLAQNKKVTNVINIAELSAITNKQLFYTKQVEDAAKLIYENHISKESSKLIHEFQQNRNQMDIFQCMNLLISNMQRLNNIKTDSISSLAELAEKELKSLEKHKNRELEEVRILLRWLKFSKNISLTKGEITCMAARPAMGKTASAISIALEAALVGHPVLFFSLEMKKDRIFRRTFANQGNIQLEDILNYNYEFEDITNIHELYSDIIFEVDDQPRLNENEIIARSLKFIEKNKNSEKHCLIIVDYIQIMGCSDKRIERDENQKIKLIMESFQGFIKSKNAHLLTLSQLNRQVENRAGDKEPQLSDLRGSGSIEETSDTVVFLHRPEYYGITEDAEGNLTANVIKFIIAKNRDGDTGTINMEHQLSKMQVYEPGCKPLFDLGFDDVNSSEIDANEAINNFEQPF